MAIICGIDEAGRGPVIGPMVVCGVAIDEKDHYKLVQLGVKDSKLLTPRKRRLLAKKIRMVCTSHLVTLGPAEIDQSVLTKGTNLNWLEAKAMTTILTALKPDKAFLDCPSPNLKAFSDRIAKEYGRPIELVAEHKADVTYPVVSAASILAKVERDMDIMLLEKEIGIPLGSGYPSDPLTQKFLAEHASTHPAVFRKSWSSWQGRNQKKLLDF